MLLKATIHHLKARLCSWIVTLSNFMLVSFIRCHHSVLQSLGCVIVIIDHSCILSYFFFNYSDISSRVQVFMIVSLCPSAV